MPQLLRRVRGNRVRTCDLQREEVQNRSDLFAVSGTLAPQRREMDMVMSLMPLGPGHLSRQNGDMIHSKIKDFLKVMSNLTD